MTAYGGVSPSSLAIHFVDDCAPELRRQFTECGINTTSVDRYDVSHPPSNKLAQLTSPLLADADHYVLCDCDLAFCGDLSPWIDGERVRAKLVDCAVFSLDDWVRILTASGLSGNEEGSDFPLPTATTLDDKPTITTYCNGGLLILPSQPFDALREAWPRWHRWLRDRRDLLSGQDYHIDQVSFALACIAEELDVDLLPDRLNLPTHLLDHLRRLEGIDPLVLHFHDRLDPRGLLCPTDVASVDRRITQANALIERRRLAQPSQTGAQPNDSHAAASFDIDADALAWAIENSEDPYLLKRLVDLSRINYGWYSQTVSRAFEGPWIAGRLGGLSERRILDIGAGVSPLPLLLANEGAKVVTVDSHAMVRDPSADRRQWNDWGFLDYAQLDERIASHHVNILDADFARSEFAAIYSMSVVEHMPAHIRLALWGRVREWLADQGLLLLTVDLVPGTDQLWNLSEGETVDPDGLHGDLDALVRELEADSFRVTEKAVLRDLPNSRTDCALLSAVAHSS